jgi:hypothetical protein
MPAETERVQLNAWSVFRKVAFVTFILLELLGWRRLAAFRFRQPRHRLLIFLFHPAFTRRALLLSLIFAGLLTLLGVVLVRLVIRPALEFWLRPKTDPSVGSFHMGAGEQVLASVPARRRVGRAWQPGSLVLTDLRLWFFPESWSTEPWWVDRGDSLRVSTEPAPIAAWLPLRNWPETVVAETAAGRRDILAVLDPSVVAAWFSNPMTTSH